MASTSHHRMGHGTGQYCLVENWATGELFHVIVIDTDTWSLRDLGSYKREWNGNGVGVVEDFSRNK